jgi:hypothetical protein
VVRATVQRKVGGYRKELPHSGDLEMWLRIAAVADVGRINGADQAYRRVHPASMMQTQHSGVLDDLRERWHAYESFFATSADGLPGGPRAHELARRRLAAEALEHACHSLDGAAPGTAFADECAELAREIDPAAEDLWQWHEYRIRRSSRTAADRALVTLLSSRRDLAARLRWRRWDRLGV